MRVWVKTVLLRTTVTLMPRFWKKMRVAIAMGMREGGTAFWIATMGCAKKRVSAGVLLGGWWAFLTICMYAPRPMPKRI